MGGQKESGSKPEFAEDVRPTVLRGLGWTGDVPELALGAMPYDFRVGPEALFEGAAPACSRFFRSLSTNTGTIQQVLDKLRYGLRGHALQGEPVGAGGKVAGGAAVPNLTPNLHGSARRETPKARASR